MVMELCRGDRLDLVLPLGGPMKKAKAMKTMKKAKAMKICKKPATMKKAMKVAK